MKLQLFDYQLQAAEVLADRDRFGLHDEMGIGKTATTIGAVNNIFAERGIVICPAMLRENWLNEFKKFSSYDYSICKGKNVHDFVSWSHGRFDILVTSYEQATKWSQDFIRSGEYIDFLAMDEAHMLKNVEAGRTRALLGHEASGADGLVNNAEHAWHITGTPMANDPMDMYAFLRFAKAIDMPPTEFVRMFMETKVGAYSTKHYPKEEMIPTLKQLIANNSIRRTHQDVGMELPDIYLNELLIEGGSIDLVDVLEAYPYVEDLIVSAIENGDIGALNASHIAIVRRLVGKAKAVAYAKMLKTELDFGCGKRVVFCWHTEALLYVSRHLHKYGYDNVAVYGDTKEDDRIAAVHRFMNDPECKVFIGNIKVAGTGLTLTSSSSIDMLESDWSPAGNAQAIKRVHRYGQKDTVNARFITLANSIDVAVNKIVQGKTASIAKIEGHTMTAAPLDI